MIVRRTTVVVGLVTIIAVVSTRIRCCLSYPFQHSHPTSNRLSLGSLTTGSCSFVHHSRYYRRMKRQSSRLLGKEAARDDNNKHDHPKRRHVETPKNSSKKVSKGKTAPSTTTSKKSPPTKQSKTSSAVVATKNSMTTTTTTTTRESATSSSTTPLYRPFRATKADEAQSLADGALLKAGWFADVNEEDQQTTILPWVGFGTYRLGQKQAYSATLQALECGYRCIDTAFIYGGETTEGEVGRALQTALADNTNILPDRSDLFLITKQWRKYHGYDETLQCLELSLKRLLVDYIDLYLIHWPGPGWTTPFRRNDVLEEHGPWHYTNVTPEQMVHLRAETWRAMEDAVRAGKIKAIGVSNFSIQHLETLRKTARLWPPAVNQVECHPLYPQHELREYCKRHGIVVQAYAALGGQDATKAQWKLLLDGFTTNVVKDKNGKSLPRNLLSTTPVRSIAQDLGVTPAQVLLRYALERQCAITPKASTREHMIENANLFTFSLTPDHMTQLNALFTKNAALQQDPHQGRLCWRSEPLRLLDFD